MSINAAMAQLNDARKMMLARWDVIHQHWNDAAAKRFEEAFIETIDRDIQKTLTGFNQTLSVIHKVQQDCS